jgi:hypothetical protein
MTNTTRPPPHLVREWLERRTHSEEPPPTPEEIRRQLGWKIIEAEREAQADGDERN